jgi:HSP20 family molecular chaperone IbpA
VAVTRYDGCVTRRDRMTASFVGAGLDTDLLVELLGTRGGAPGPVRPDTDVYMTEDPPTLNMTMDLAGLDPETLHVALDGDVLSVSGLRRRPDEQGRRIYHLAEIDWGRFERTLRLATPVDPKASRVTYARGLLHIALPLASRPVISRVILTVRVAG